MPPQDVLDALARAAERYAQEPEEALRLGRLALAEQDDPAVVRAAHALIARGCFATGRLDDAADHAQRCVDASEGLPPDGNLVAMLLALGAVHRRQGRTAEGITRVREALEVAQAIEDVDQTAVAHNNLGLSYLNLGELDGALEHFTAAVGLQDQVSEALSVQLSASLHNNIGLAHVERGALERSLREFEQAIEQARSTGNVREQIRFSRNLASQLTKLERFEEAVSCLRSLVALSEAVGDGGAARASAERSLGSIALSTGEPDTALAHFERSAELLRETGEVRELATTLQLASTAALDLGRVDHALALADRSLELARSLGDPRTVIRSLRRLTQVHEARGDLRAAVDAHKALLEAQTRLNQSVQERRLNALQGRLEVAQATREARLERDRAVQLEARVAERTAELADANARLQVALARAESADASKNAFLAIASHELRTPLNAILGYGELVREELGEVDPVELEQPVDRILEAGRSLLALIERILAMTSLEARAIDLSPAVVDLEPLTADVLHQAQPWMARRSNTLTAAVDLPSAPLTTDPTLLRELLLLLLENAAAFTEQGTITLEVSPEAEGLRLGVRDTGVGIDPAVLERVFQPFRQQDESFTRTHGGLGLGLSLARRYAELLGGTLQVESAPGVGSVFSVRLPLDQPGANTKG